MLNVVVNTIVQHLELNDIYAVNKYAPGEILRDKATVCVSLKSAKITASGCGNYIGFSAESTEFKEMFGSKGELCIKFEIYGPLYVFDQLKADLCDCLAGMSLVNIRSFEAGEVSFDSKSELFRCECSANATVCLVRQISDPDGPFGLWEE